MNKIFAVYYDNGQSYEDNARNIVSVFASIEGAESFVLEKNKTLIFVPSMTEEEFIKERGIENRNDYEHLYYTEEREHDYMYGGYYFINEYEVNP